MTGAAHVAMREYNDRDKLLFPPIPPLLRHPVTYITIDEVHSLVITIL